MFLLWTVMLCMSYFQITTRYDWHPYITFNIYINVMFYLNLCWSVFICLSISRIVHSGRCVTFRSFLRFRFLVTRVIIWQLQCRPHEAMSATRYKLIYKNNAHGFAWNLNKRTKHLLYYCALMRKLETGVKRRGIEHRCIHYINIIECRYNAVTYYIILHK